MVDQKKFVLLIKNVKWEINYTVWGVSMCGAILIIFPLREKLWITTKQNKGRFNHQLFSVTCLIRVWLDEINAIAKETDSLQSDIWLFENYFINCLYFLLAFHKFHCLYWLHFWKMMDSDWSPFLVENTSTERWWHNVTC